MSAMTRASLLLIASLSVTLVSASTFVSGSDVEQHLRDQYQGKTFVLRGFYSDDKLRFDATGAPVGKPRHGDWTSDGFVTVGKIQISGRQLVIETKRKIVVANSHSRTLQLRDLVTGVFENKRFIPLKIEVDLGEKDASSGAVDAAVNRIFLTTEDSFIEKIPGYWKPCILADYGGKDSKCHLSPEMLTVPGLGLSANSGSVASQSENTDVPPLLHVGKGVTAPVPTYKPDPPFSERARQQKIQGTVLLSFVLDSEGHPTKIRIVAPVGCGLDEMAVRSAEAWRFIPARKDGQNVSVELALEVDFHLY